jgi:hypothetical protein
MGDQQHSQQHHGSHQTQHAQNPSGNEWQLAFIEDLFDQFHNSQEREVCAAVQEW